MSADRLPVEFQDLDGLVDEWAIATSGARADQRLTSTIETLRAFYDQLEPRAASALAYLQGITLEALTTTDATLLRPLSPRAPLCSGRRTGRPLLRRP